MIHSLGCSVYLWDDVQVLIAQRKMLRIQPKRRSNHFEESASSCRETRILPHVRFESGLELLHRLLFVPRYEGMSARDDGSDDGLMGNIVLITLSFNGTLVFLLFIHHKSKLSKVCSKILLVFDVETLIVPLSP